MHSSKRKNNSNNSNERENNDKDNDERKNRYTGTGRVPGDLEGQMAVMEIHQEMLGLRIYTINIYKDVNRIS